MSISRPWRELCFPIMKALTILIAYNDFINRLNSVVNAVAPFETAMVKNNTSEWFDGEIADEILMCDKLYKRFELTKLHFDEEIYKEAQNIVQNLNVISI